MTYGTGREATLGRGRLAWRWVAVPTYFPLKGIYFAVGMDDSKRKQDAYLRECTFSLGTGLRMA
jgi:hypothetical protein